MMSGRVDIEENASLFISCPNGPPSSCWSSKAPVQLGTITNGDRGAFINNARVEQIVAVVRHGCHSEAGSCRGKSRCLSSDSGRQLNSMLWLLRESRLCGMAM